MYLLVFVVFNDYKFFENIIYLFILLNCLDICVFYLCFLFLLMNVVYFFCKDICNGG